MTYTNEWINIQMNYVPFTIIVVKGARTGGWTDGGGGILEKGKLTKPL